MSYAIHPYAVRIDAIRKLLGSKDDRLLQTLRKEFRGEFAEIDELDEDTSPVEKALTDLINGTKRDEDSGFKYGYALEFICEHLGELLSNRHWSAMGWDWIEEIDGVLAKLGVDATSLRIEKHLTTRGAPINLPPIHDFPAIGYLRLAEIRKVRKLLPSPEAIGDEDVRASVAELRSWLDHCIEKGCDLVCFYH